MYDDTVYWIAFNKIRVFPTNLLLKLQNKFGSLKKLWFFESESFIDIRASYDINNRLWERFIKKRDEIDLKDCSSEITLATRNKIQILTPNDPDYPSWLLKSLENAPFALYVYGKMLRDKKEAISIIGTRNPSFYGRMKTYEISKQLAKNGYTIVSGLARGVDSIAHVGALAAGGKTVAVLANGLLKHPKDSVNFNSPLIIYPSEHSELASDIVENGGCLISETSFGTKARSFRLLDRNRLVAGLSDASLAIEGGKRTGTASEINYAKKMQRRIFALRPVNEERQSAIFPSLLIKNRIATPIDNAEDIITELRTSKNVSLD